MDEITFKLVTTCCSSIRRRLLVCSTIRVGDINWIS